MKLLRPLIGAALALALCMPAAAAPPPKGDATLADVLPICDRALVAALDGHDAKASVMADVKDMPPERQQAIALICAIYLAGAVSVLKHEREVGPLPSGGRSI